MKLLEKKILALLAIGTITAASIPYNVYGGQNSYSYNSSGLISNQSVDTTIKNLPSNDELFAGYVNNLFYGGEYSVKAMSNNNSGSFMDNSSINKYMYTQLKGLVKEVADGNRTSTKFEVRAQGKSLTGFDLNEIVVALLYDCPYEMYWYNKNEQISAISKYSNYGDVVVTFSFPVSNDYKAGDSYTINTNKTGVAKKALLNAQAIVDKYSSMGDREKLTAYRDEICKRVSYNNEAAKNNPPYGDPWQMIYVFDDNTSNQVVCEGYSKAFQYLCDISKFDNAICYTVSGIMSSPTVTGRHMWNVVKLNGQNYLVDVTNCDGYSVPSDNLFLRTAPSKNNGRSHSISFKNYNSTVTFGYEYDDDMKDLYSSGYLDLTEVVSNKAALSGQITSNNPSKPTLISLVQNGQTRYTSTIAATSGTGSVTQGFTVKDVVAGTYDVIITKDGHLSYTITNVVVGNTNIDLRTLTSKPYQSIVLPSGNMNNDNFVNFTDIQILRGKNNYGKTIGDTGVNGLSDINGDGFINFSDLQIIRGNSNYGKSNTTIGY